MRRETRAASLLVLSALLLGGACSAAPSVTRGRAGAVDTAATAPGTPTVRLLARFRATQPIGLESSGDGSGRLFIVEKPGRVRIGRLAENRLVATPFLDISRLVSTGGEQGLLGLAFPPGFGTSKQHLYVDYTDSNGDTVVARYRVSADPDRADPASAERILWIDQPYANHNGGQIAFGPDGYLYVGMGEGGGSGDPHGNGQRTDTLLGKMLRIDVEAGISPYRVPSDNPFVGRSGYKPEIWSLGLRNPWRFSFDRLTGDLYIADVGQNRIEEVDVEPTGSGGRNYGWNHYEGSLPFPPGSAPRPTAGLTFPVHEYTHDQGDDCITGGYVYRGSRYPAWEGRYFFGDFETGRIWSMSTTTHAVALALDTPFLITTFGQDDSGELYLAEYMDGTVYELRDGAEPPAVPLARIAGADRYETAAAAARRAFPSGCTTAVVASGEAFPDALAASALAGALDAPVLLTRRDSVPAALASVLATGSLGVRDIVIVGGYGAVARQVEDELASAGRSVRRIAGEDRYQTAAAVAREAARLLGHSFTGEVFIVRGDVFADALSAAPAAAANGMPVLLAKPDALPPATRSALADIGAARAWIVGGAAAVSDSVAGGLGIPWARISGIDRYATAAALRAEAVKRGWSDGRVLGVASGESFPDGLTGGAALGADRGVLLLTRAGLLPPHTRQALIDSQPAARTAYLFGGNAAVSAAVQQLVRWHVP